MLWVEVKQGGQKMVLQEVQVSSDTVDLHLEHLMELGTIWRGEDGGN